MRDSSNQLTTLILRALESAPGGMTRTQIHALFHRHKPNSQIKRALQELLEQGHAWFELRRTAGRPAERWFKTNRAIRQEPPPEVTQAVTAIVPRSVRNQAAVNRVIGMASKILQALRMAPAGLPLSALHNLVSRDRRAAEIHQALLLLHQGGLAAFRLRRSRGRPAHRWFAL
jgi:predicted ArsR family transcriptional regulator